MKRIDLVKMLGESRQGWYPQLAYASAHISRAIVSGAITADDITTFQNATSGGQSASDLCRDLVRKSGIALGQAEADPDASWPAYATEFEISLTFEVLADLTLGNASIEADGWFLYEEELEPFGVTITDVMNSLVRECPTITDAAQLIVDADNPPTTRAPEAQATEEKG